MSRLAVLIVAQALMVTGVVLFLVFLFPLNEGQPTTFDDFPFNLHPLMMVLGFALLVGEGLVAWQVWPISHRWRKVMHGALGGAAVLCSLGGLSAVLVFHHQQGYPNFKSMHSWVGLTTLVLTWMQFALGFVAFAFPGLAPHLRSAALPWHKWLGLVIYGYSMVAIISGMQEKFPATSDYPRLIRFAGLLILFSSAFVALGVYLKNASSDSSSHSSGEELGTRRVINDDEY